MAIVLGPNQYGKAECRLLTVTRTDTAHHIRDLNVGIALRGDYEACHRHGDNAHIVATDTQKNTVYAFAKRYGVAEIEDFALLLGRHFVDTFDFVRGARVRIEEYPWQRVGAHDGDPRPHAFTRGGAELRTTEVTVHRDAVRVVSGLADLVVLKSTGSEFRGYPKDAYTTLPETDDRILATAVTARWRYGGDVGRDTPDGGGPVDWAASFAATRTILIERFADQYSKSLQQTLYDMGESVLARRAEIAEIAMSMPNRHHFAVDLEPFGLDNAGEVFFPADRPYGLIEGTVTRDDAPDDPGRGPFPDSPWESAWNFSSR